MILITKYYIYDLETNRLIDIVNSFYNIIFPDAVSFYNSGYSGCYDPYMHVTMNFYDKIYIKAGSRLIYLSYIANHHNEYYNDNVCKNSLFYRPEKSYLIIDSLNRYVSVEVLKNIFFENYNSGYYDYKFYFLKERNKKHKSVIKKNYINAAKNFVNGEKTKFFNKYFGKRYDYIFRVGSVPGIRRRRFSNMFRSVQTFSELKNRIDYSLKDDIENIDIQNCTIRTNINTIRTRHIPDSREDIYYNYDRSWKRNSKARKSWDKRKNKGVYI